MRVEDRPTDMLLRQLAANRLAARGRDAQRRKLFCHILPYRPHFVREMLAMRAELKKRNVQMPAMATRGDHGSNAEADGRATPRMSVGARGNTAEGKTRSNAVCDERRSRVGSNSARCATIDTIGARN